MSVIMTKLTFWFELQIRIHFFITIFSLSKTIVAVSIKLLALKEIFLCSLFYPRISYDLFVRLPK